MWEADIAAFIGDAGLLPLGSAYEVHGRRCVAQMEAKRVAEIIAVEPIRRSSAQVARALITVEAKGTEDGLVEPGGIEPPTS